MIEAIIIINKLLKDYGYIGMSIESFKSININNYHNWIHDVESLIYMVNLKLVINILKKSLSLKCKIEKSFFILKYNKQDIFKRFTYAFILKRLKLYLNNMFFLNTVEWDEFNKLKIINLPVKFSYVGTLKSPHVFKKAQDHYEFRKHKYYLKTPLIYNNYKKVSSLLEQTTRLKAIDQVKFKKKNIFLLKNINENW